jgi:galactose-1-phosphate uridylyltransferase
MSAISKIAGFERGTGVYINSISPEYAAAKLSALAKSEISSPKS